MYVAQTFGLVADTRVHVQMPGMLTYGPGAAAGAGAAMVTDAQIADDEEDGTSDSGAERAIEEPRHVDQVLRESAQECGQFEPTDLPDDDGRVSHAATRDFVTQE